MPLAQQFAQDRQGRRFADVLSDTRISFPAILAFFNDPQRQRRLIESELHHDRPALAGVICELEHRQDVDQFFRTNQGHVTTRFRQAIGVMVRIIMESHGWENDGAEGVARRAGERADPDGHDRGRPQHGRSGAVVHPCRALRTRGRDAVPLGGGASRRDRTNYSNDGARVTGSVQAL